MRWCCDNVAVRVSHFLPLVLTTAIAGASCTTFNNARPLKPGEAAAALTVGGPITGVPGIGDIPLPNATLEGRNGLVEHLDINYGVHLLPTVFGVLGGHVGATYQFYDQPDPLFPALAVGQRFFFFTNIFDPRKENKDAFAMSQTDLTLSWELWDSLIYGGISAYVPIDVEDRTLHIAPVIGAEIHPGIDWLRIQLETRWLSPWTDQRFAVVNWRGINDHGAIAVNVGVAIEFTELIGILLFGDDDGDTNDTSVTNEEEVQP